MWLLLASTSLAVVCGYGCNRPAPPERAADQHPDPVAAELHGRLLRAAGSGDVPAFKTLLTERSIRLLDGYFEAASRLDRPPGARPFGWKALLKEHAELPPEARLRAPYPVVGGKLDLAGHPDARFFSDAAGAIGAGAVPHN